MASFPTSTKTFTTLVDLADSVLAAHQNDRGGEITAIENYLREAATEVSVSGGVLTVTKSRHTVQPESGTSDDVDTIDGMPDNTLLVLMASDEGTDTLTFKHGTGNISCFNGEDISLSEGSVLCYYDGSTVFMVGGGNPQFTDRSISIEGLKLIWNSLTSISVGVGSCYAENGDYIDVTSALTAASLSLSNSTWYHVYVYLNSGTPAVEVVTTAPVAWKGTAYSKTGDTSRRYVGSIRTDGSGNVYEFLHTPNSGLMLYSGDCDLDASPFRALNAGTATTATAVDMSAVIPATAKIGYLRLLNTGSVIVSFGPTSNVTGAALGIGSSTQTSFIGQFPLTSSQQYYYKFASAPSGAAYIDVYGYVFER